MTLVVSCHSNLSNKKNRIIKKYRCYHGNSKKNKKIYRFTFYNNKDIILKFSSVYFDSIQKHLNISIMFLFFIQTSWVMKYWFPWKPKKDFDFKSGRWLNKMSDFCYFVSTKLFLCLKRVFRTFIFNKE